MGNPSFATPAVPALAPKRLAFFERYLTVWVLLCMVVGVAFGHWLPGVTSALSQLEFGRGSKVNVPVGILLWLMIYPMMLKVDFSAIGGIAKRPKGLLVTLFVNSGLLFVLEPLVGKGLLPVMGGGAAVWTTTAAFFQLACSRVTCTRMRGGPAMGCDVTHGWRPSCVTERHHRSGW